MAMTEPTAAPLETATDPSRGTPPAATPVPAEATPQSPAPTVDWETRYKAAQAELTKQQMARSEAERQRDALRQQQSEPDDEEDTAAGRRVARRSSETEAELRRQLADRDLQIARSVYGDETFMAAQTFEQLLATAATPADRIGALEVYRTRFLVPPSVPTLTPEPPPPAPVVDSNRSDAPASAEVDQKLREAVEKKDLLGGIQAMLRRG